MEKAFLGLKTETSVTFDVSDALFFVKTRTGVSFGSQACSDDAPCSAAWQAVADCDVRWKVAQEGTTIFNLPSGEVLLDRLHALRQHPDVTVAGPMLVSSDTRHPVFYTDRLYIQFRAELSQAYIDAQITSSGLSIAQSAAYAKNAYWATFGTPIGRDIFARAIGFLARGDVTSCYPEMLEVRPRRAAHPNQWHLQKTMVRYEDVIDASANVIEAHRQSTGRGRIIAVIDDSVDIDHVEFAGAGKVVYPRNFGPGNENDPRPVPGNSHGTAVAGVACANGYEGACGVAPDASLMPIRISMSGEGGSATRAEHGASAIRWAADHHADVIVCSWGLGEWFPNWYEALPHFSDDRPQLVAANAAQFMSIDAPQQNQASARDKACDAEQDKKRDAEQDKERNIKSDRQRDGIREQYALTDGLRAAFEYAATKGRGGKGCLIFCAVGNSNVDIAEYNGMATSPHVMAIGSCNEKGERSAYSNFGDALFCVFPSDDYAYKPYTELRSRGIWTLETAVYPMDPVGIPNVKGLYLQSFGGTSSAAPGVAGVAALMLAANPALTWHQAREILAKSCTKIDEQMGDYSKETGHSRQYGYGRVDAALAVKLAMEYVPQP